MNACIRCNGRRQGQYVQRLGHYCKRCFGVGAVSAQHHRGQQSHSSYSYSYYYCVVITTPRAVWAQTKACRTLAAQRLPRSRRRPSVGCFGLAHRLLRPVLRWRPTGAAQALGAQSWTRLTGFCGRSFSTTDVAWRGHREIPRVSLRETTPWAYGLREVGRSWPASTTCVAQRMTTLGITGGSAYTTTSLRSSSSAQMFPAGTPKVTSLRRVSARASWLGTSSDNRGSISERNHQTRWHTRLLFSRHSRLAA